MLNLRKNVIISTSKPVVEHILPSTLMQQGWSSIWLDIRKSAEEWFRAVTFQFPFSLLDTKVSLARASVFFLGALLWKTCSHWTLTHSFQTTWKSLSTKYSNLCPPCLPSIVWASIYGFFNPALFKAYAPFFQYVSKCNGTVAIYT